LSSTRTGRRAGARRVGGPTVAANAKARRGRGAQAQGRSGAKRRGRRLGWLGRGVALCVAVVLGLVAWAALARTLAPKSNTERSRFDVLIVLGSPADADGNPTPTELERVTEAVHEYERGLAPRIIFTGGAVQNRFVEAQVMARTAEAQGIPELVVFVEPQARNTIENACDSVRMMQSHGWRSAEVISNASHLPRAGMIFSRLPVEWRVHAAPELEPAQTGAETAATLLELLKTVRYLVWSRQAEPCRL
jgi:uncharacterized SAM-binding protein YcdF (DUF218 family)